MIYQWFNFHKVKTIQRLQSSARESATLEADMELSEHSFSPHSKLNGCESEIESHFNLNTNIALRNLKYVGFNWLTACT